MASFKLPAYVHEILVTKYYWRHVITWRTQRWPKHEARMGWQEARKGRYTLSVKLSDFTLWRHTWQKNWVDCAVLTGNNAGLRTVLSSRLSHTELCSSLRESHSFLSLPANTTMASYSLYNLQYPFLAIHSADEHRLIYSFSNTTSYFTFYAFFFSFRITWWPMWLVNSKRQPCFYPLQSHAQEDKQNWPKKKKTDKPDGKPVLCQKTFSSIFRAAIFTQLNNIV